MTTELTKTEKDLIAKEGIMRKRIVIALAAAAVIPAGTVLGRITASRKFLPYAVGSADGSEVPACITLEEVDASVADAECVCGYVGQYVKRNLTGLDENAEDLLEARGIIMDEL